MISKKTRVTLEFFEHYRIQDNNVHADALANLASTKGLEYRERHPIRFLRNA